MKIVSYIMVFNRGDYEIKLNGMNLMIHEGVFSPDFLKTNSSSMILNNLPDVDSKDVLDVGCGSGVIGIYCAIKGARRVLSVDVNEKAINNTKENAVRNKVSDIVSVKESDLLDSVSGKFDFIFGNLPIVDSAWDLKVSTVDLLEKFLEQSMKHLNKNGKVFFAWCSSQDVEPVKKCLLDAKYFFKETKENRLGLEWYLFEINK
jgi:16S rRNA G1207 methylase RsmC